MSIDPTRPPDTWGVGAVVVAPRVVYAWLDDIAPTFWHWCLTQGQWVAADAAYTIAVRDPLTVDPEISWPCCSLRGHIHEGRWIP